MLCRTRTRTRTRTLRAAAALTAALSLPVAAGVGTPALAVGDTDLLQPDNDTAAGAVVVTALPYLAYGDTTNATRDSDDASSCNGTGPTIWYAFTPSQDITVAASTSGNSFDTVLLAYTGSPGALTLLACDDDSAGGLASRLVLPLTGGQTYYLAISGYSGSAGSTALSVDELPPLDGAATVTAATVSRTGRVTVTGTISCTGDPAYIGYAYITVSQSNRRFNASGSVDTGLSGQPCGSAPTAFSAQLTSATSAAFLPGTATVRIDGYVYDVHWQYDDLAMHTTLRMPGVR